MQDDGRVFSVPHLVVLEGDGSILGPAVWDTSLLYVPGGLRLAVLLVQ